VTKVVITVALGERLGGSENMLWTFLRHVDKRRIEPLVIFLQHGPFAREVAALGIRTIVLPAGRLRQGRTTIRTVTSLARLFRRERPDLILNWMGKSQLYAAPAAMLAAMSDRLVWWQHGVPTGHWLDRLATLLPTKAVGCSSHAAAQAQEQLRPRRTTYVVHPGIDPPSVSADERLTLRSSLAISDGTAVLGIVGRLQPWKGQDRFVKALAELIRLGHDVHGLIVGGNAYDLSPEYEQDVQRLARELKVASHLSFTGQVDEALPYISLMDVLVNASAPEPFGLVLIEAMGLGIPVVAVNTGGPAEIVDSGRSGLLVARSTPELIAQALERLIRDAELREQMGQGARERFLSCFTAARMVDSLEHMLEELASR
jgi:glycosyltransferase involved in cell wall biosynthesis